jgi:hypothetical protein
MPVITSAQALHCSACTSELRGSRIQVGAEPSP